MGLLSWLFSEKKSNRSSGRITFKSVDWLDVEHRFATVQSLARSASQADKKQAIIQADMLFDQILKQASVPGATMGERLKSLKTALPHPTYQKLWQAHLKRNELVHDAGSFVADFELSHITSFQEAMSKVRGIR